MEYVEVPLNVAPTVAIVASEIRVRLKADRTGTVLVQFAAVTPSGETVPLGDRYDVSLSASDLVAECPGLDLMAAYPAVIASAVRRNPELAAQVAAVSAWQASASVESPA